MNKDYDLRQPYNNVSLVAIGKLKISGESAINSALYGVYCEALTAVKKAIKEGATISDLEKAITDFGANEGRIVKDRN